TTGMLIIGVIGLVVNITVAIIMFKGSDTKDNLNMRGAYLHVMSDTLGSVGAIVAALLIMIFGWGLADPIASVVVAALILRSGNKKVYVIDELLHALEKSLEHLGIQHITLQIESEQHYHDESILCEVEIEEPSLHHHH